MYSFPYLLLAFLFSCLAFLSLKSKKIEKKNYVIIFIVYLIFFGFRGYVGSDFVTYYDMFNNLPIIGKNWTYSSFTDSNIEKGFLLYMSILKSINNDYSFFVFINTLINISCILLFFKRYSSNVALSIVVFLEIGGLIFETDVLRNMKSLLLFLLSIKYISERRPVPYFMFNIVGLFFHSSSLIYFPMYWLLSRPISLRLFWLLFIIGNIIYLGRIQILSFIVLPILNILGNRYSILASNYLDSGILSEYGLTIGYILRICVALLISVYYKKLLSYKSYNVVFINAIFIYLLLFCYFSEIRILAIRMTNLFFFSYAVLIPQFLVLLRYRSNKYIFITLVVLISLLKIHGKVNTPIYQYDMVLFDHKNVLERKFEIDDFYISLE